MKTWNAIQGDTHRQYGRFSAGLLLLGTLTSRTFRAILTMRLCRATANAAGLVRLLLPLCKLLHRFATHWAAVEFSWKTDVGAGLAIHHGFGLVVSPGVRIGRNVTLFHGVTLGRRDRISPINGRQSGFPVIEDEVWVGPHAIIVGGVTIGRGSRIAGGTFIAHSIPPYSVVAGNPGRIIRERCTPDVLNPAPLDGCSRQRGDRR